MRWQVCFLSIICLILQYQLWLAPGGVMSISKMRQQIRSKKSKIAQLERANDQIRENIRHLAHGLDSIETVARRNLGLIKQGEVYYQVVETRSKKTRSF